MKIFVSWPHIPGSNSMVRGMAWDSIIKRLDNLNINYYQAAHQHTVIMHEHDFTVFQLKWTVEHDYQRWNVWDVSRSFSQE